MTESSIADGYANRVGVDQLPLNILVNENWGHTVGSPRPSLSLSAEDTVFIREPGGSPQETDRRANQALKAPLNLAHSESRFQRWRCFVAMKSWGVAQAVADYAAP